MDVTSGSTHSEAIRRRGSPIETVANLGENTVFVGERNARFNTGAALQPSMMEVSTLVESFSEEWNHALGTVAEAVRTVVCITHSNSPGATMSGSPFDYFTNPRKQRS
jgi:hypothetical protein